MKTNPNDPAISSLVDADQVGNWHTGLTKREYFAGLAMQGYCSLIHRQELIDKFGSKHEWLKFLASQATEQADALIVELNRARK
jgi:hypothetical protein